MVSYYNITGSAQTFKPDLGSKGWAGGEVRRWKGWGEELDAGLGFRL